MYSFFSLSSPCLPLLSIIESEHHPTWEKSLNALANPVVPHLLSWLGVRLLDLPTAKLRNCWAQEEKGWFFFHRPLYKFFIQIHFYRADPFSWILQCGLARSPTRHWLEEIWNIGLTSPPDTHRPPTLTPPNSSEIVYPLAPCRDLLLGNKCRMLSPKKSFHYCLR